jgi:hypothetical protein
MKWIGYIITLLILVALATSPSNKKFEKHIYSSIDTTACTPLISHKSFGIFSLRLFSLHTAKPCMSIRNYPSLPSGAGIGVYGKEETYLGLFGKFWKL